MTRIKEKKAPLITKKNIPLECFIEHLRQIVRNRGGYERKEEGKEKETHLKGAREKEGLHWF